MTLNLCTQTAAAATAAHKIEIVLRELELIIERLTTAGFEAGRLSALTDWSAKSARAFHEESETWATDVRSLPDLATDLHAGVRIARARAAAATGPWCR